MTFVQGSNVMASPHIPFLSKEESTTLLSESYVGEGSITDPAFHTTSMYPKDWQLIFPSKASKQANFLSDIQLGQYEFLYQFHHPKAKHTSLSWLVGLDDPSQPSSSTLETIIKHFRQSATFSNIDIIEDITLPSNTPSTSDNSRRVLFRYEYDGQIIYRIIAVWRKYKLTIIYDAMATEAQFQHYNRMLATSGSYINFKHTDLMKQRVDERLSDLHN